MSTLKPRISLLTFLLLTVLICLGVSHWHTSRELARARAELRQLRDEAGYLSIEDRSKLHAVALQTEDRHTWRWRLFIPKGHRYRWNLACQEIPPTTPPAQAAVAGMSNEPYWKTDNEVVVTARLRKGEDGDWKLSVDSKIGDSKNQMSGATLSIPAEQMEWMTTVSSTDGQVIGDNGTAICDPAGPIILVARRPCEEQPDGSYRPSEGKMPGFIIWMSEM